MIAHEFVVAGAIGLKTIGVVAVLKGAGFGFSEFAEVGVFEVAFSAVHELLLLLLLLLVVVVVCWLVKKDEEEEDDDDDDVGEEDR